MRTDFLCNLAVKVIDSNFKIVTALVVYGFQLQNQNDRSHKHLTPDNMKEDTVQFLIISFGLHIVILCGMVSQEVVEKYS